MQMEEMSATSDPPLLKLPPELRNRIYDAILLSNNPIIVRIERPGPKWQPPPLLQTCHQDRAEAIGIYFAGNTFRCYFLRDSGRRHTNPDGRDVVQHRTSDFAQWLTAIGKESSSLLRTVYLDDQYYDDKREARSALHRYRQHLRLSNINVDKTRLFVEIADEYHPDEQWFGDAE